MSCITRFFYQRGLLCSCHMLDMPFAAHGLFLGIEGLVIHKLHRKAAAGIFGTLAAVVGIYAFFKIVRPAGIHGIIRTADYICVIHFNYQMCVDGNPSQTLPVIAVKVSYIVIPMPQVPFWQT